MEMLGLHNLTVSQGSKKSKKRLGRGNASKGNQSGRGGKGQRARSGGKSGLILKGIKGYLQKIPKKRGFNSLKIKPAEANLFMLEKAYQAGDTVSPKSLFNKTLIKTAQYGVKILSSGKLTKKLTVKAQYFSTSAAKAIVDAGGTAVVIPIPDNHPVRKVAINK
jgi:large subunit ribosomal protein L15